MPFSINWQEKSEFNIKRRYRLVIQMTAKKSRKRLRKKKVGNRQRKIRKKQARETKKFKL